MGHDPLLDCPRTGGRPESRREDRPLLVMGPGGLAFNTRIGEEAMNDSKRTGRCRVPTEFWPRVIRLASQMSETTPSIHGLLIACADNEDYIHLGSSGAHSDQWGLERGRGLEVSLR